MGSSLWGCKELDAIEWLTHTYAHVLSSGPAWHAALNTSQHSPQARPLSDAIRLPGSRHHITKQLPPYLLARVGFHGPSQPLEVRATDDCSFRKQSRVVFLQG